MLIETHAHLDYPDFANDLEDVLRRAAEAGVTRIITIGTSLESSRRAIDLAERYSAIYAAIGVHPTCVQEAEEDVFTPLRDLAKHPRVVAIGETGLDYHQLPREEVCSHTPANCAVFFIVLAVRSIRRMKFSSLTTSFRSLELSLSKTAQLCEKSRRKSRSGNSWWKPIAHIWRLFRSAENAANRRTHASWRKRSPQRGQS